MALEPIPEIYVCEFQRWVVGIMRTMQIKEFLQGLTFAFISLGSVSALADSSASLELSNSQYFRANESYFRDGAVSSATSMKIGLKGSFYRRGFFGDLNLRDDYQAEENFHYVKPFDANIGWRSEHTEFRIGRYRYEWSQSDSEWRIGLWQPRFTDDFLHRESAGLTGAFWSAGSDQLQFMVFATPVFAPEMGANFQVEDRRFVSKNPWFLPPPSQVRFKGDLVDVFYDFARPDASEVVNHAAAASKVRWQPSEEGYLQFSASYKPINQFLLGFPATVRSDGVTNTMYAEVQVHARVLYHELYTLEAGQKLNGWTSWMSLTQENPHRDQTPAEWITQELQPATVVSGYVGYDLRGEGKNATHGFVSHFYVQGGDAPDLGELKGSGDSLFTPRYMFKNATKIGLRHPFPFAKSGGLTRLITALTSDWDQHGIEYSARIEHPVAKYWQLAFEAEWLGLWDDSVLQKKGYTNLYRSNDRILLGVQYVF